MGSVHDVTAHGEEAQAQPSRQTTSRLPEASYCGPVRCLVVQRLENLGDQVCVPRRRAVHPHILVPCSDAGNPCHSSRPPRRSARSPLWAELHGASTTSRYWEVHAEVPAGQCGAKESPAGADCPTAGMARAPRAHAKFEQFFPCRAFLAAQIHTYPGKREKVAEPHTACPTDLIPSSISTNLTSSSPSPSPSLTPPVRPRRRNEASDSHIPPTLIQTTPTSSHG